jgi:glycosyltransferase involved in cell wall biosynthesis
MRILHSNIGVYPQRGGPPAVIANLAAAQARAGHDVVVLTVENPSDPPGATRAMLDVLDGGSQVAVLEHRNSAQLRWFIPGIDPLLGWRGDIVHCHELWNPFDWAITRCARKRGIPYLVTPHGLMSEHRLRKGSVKKRIARFLWVDQLLGHASAVQALTQHEREALLRTIPTLRVVTVANGFTVPERESACVPLPNCLDRSQFILFMSRLEAMKGTKTLIEAFAEVVRDHPSVHLAIAGPDYGARASMENDCERLGVGSRVHFLGMVQSPLKESILRRATAFVLPSQDEGFSIAILEAMAHGCAVVISPECHFPEAARARAAIEVAGEKSKLADAICHLIEDSETRAQLGINAKRLVASEYTWDSIAQKLVSVYEHCCEEGGPSRNL